MRLMKFGNYSLRGFLTNPLLVLGSIIVGILIGIHNKSFANMIAPFGQLYLSALQMTVLPLIISMMISSIVRFMQSTGLKVSVGTIILIFCVSLTLSTLVGAICASIFQPGLNIDQEMLANIMRDAAPSLIKEVDLKTPIETGALSNIAYFLAELIPRNFFTSLTEGKILQIVVFSIIFGTAIGSLSNKSQENLLNVFESSQKALHKILSWLSIILPFGVCCLIATQLSSLDTSLLFIMTNYLLSISLAFFIIIFVSSLIIWAKSKIGYLQSLNMMSTAVFVALSTRNSFLAMSEAIDAFTNKLKFDFLTTNLILPLGITLCRTGNVLYFAFTTIFIAQLYSVPITFTSYSIILLGSIIAGITTSGATGIASIGLISLILEPLGLPLGAVFVLLIAVDVIVDPLRTLAIVYPNCAATSLIAKRSINQEV